ncbi:MAG: SHOCT domain-containing protein [Chloroflexi bacterium]|nr:SHOCT domain-containing protein [Chloroflexota bacterium]
MDDFFNTLCFGVLVVSVLIIIWIFYNGDQKRKRIREAKKNYEISLEQLKTAPDDANLRQKTLLLGREFARVAREGGKETLFDEMALMNDINAVAGGAPTKRIEERGKSASVRLEELQKMKDQGLISEDEYNAKRSTILDEM